MYKYTRKELSKMFMNPQYGWGRLIDDLLAQKEDRKECKCKKPNYKTVITAHGLNKLMCIKCGKELPTPSLDKKECKHVGNTNSGHYTITYQAGESGTTFTRIERPTPSPEKECEHRWVGVTTIDGKKWCEIHDKFEQFIPTPSPLELPKIHNNFSSIEQYNWAKQITDEVKKLYQYIKEKI